MYMDSTTSLDRASIWISERLISLQNSRHIKYAIKLMVVMGALSMPAFISNWVVWYDGMRAQLAMISALVAMETTRGMTFRTAGMKLSGALLGGLLGFTVFEIGGGRPAVSMALTPLIGLGVGHLVVHPVWAKSGTVCSLAYNLILGVATVFPQQGPITGVFARRRILRADLGALETPRWQRGDGEANQVKTRDP